MRRWSLSPPRRGTTHSRYSPPWTTTVSPGCATAAARLIVRNGPSSDPAAASEPVVATWSTELMACRDLLSGVSWLRMASAVDGRASQGPDWQPTGATGPRRRVATAHPHPPKGTHHEHH